MSKLVAPPGRFIERRAVRRKAGGNWTLGVAASTPCHVCPVTRCCGASWEPGVRPAALIDPPAETDSFSKRPAPPQARLLPSSPPHSPAPSFPCPVFIWVISLLLYLSPDIWFVVRRKNSRGICTLCANETRVNLIFGIK